MLLVGAILPVAPAPVGGGENVWKPVTGQMMTRWAKEVSAEAALPDYPRPMMVREQWLNLNGLWEFAIGPAVVETVPEQFDRQILVPFAPDSALSGVKRTTLESDRLWYRRSFELPAGWAGQRVLLHFGAVDWESRAWVNGKEAIAHRGGYDPFSVDITGFLKPGGPQELVVSAWDPSDKGRQPRGKQVIAPHGFNYTGVSGIWQTVWLEPVPEASVRALHTDPDVDANCAWVIADVVGAGRGYTLEATTMLPEPGEENGTVPVRAAGPVGKRLRIPLRKEPATRLWSPDLPYLYDLQVRLKDRDGKVIDELDSYFGMRKIAVQKDEDGFNRLLLNNEPLFQYGFLDQGWWPDGLYTAPTDEALRHDIETAKRLGANMVRKHVKVEPRRFYHHCDKLGILVWQDMPSGSGNDEHFAQELKGMIDATRSHPSIVMWVLFNEGWGQHAAPRFAKWTKDYDPTRLIDHASGWADRGEFGDVRDVHIYDGGPGVAPPFGDRAMVLGEFGGIGMTVPGHAWKPGEGHGHGGRGDGDQDLTEPYLRLLRKLPAMRRLGLCAAVYTQIADQEIEENGVMTYDRELLKFDAEKVRAETLSLYAPPPLVKTLLATSEVVPQEWSYTFRKPAADWCAPDFDAAGWKTGPGAFGDFDPTFPTLIIAPRTPWTSSDIWIRRTFELEDLDLIRPYLLIHHDESAEVYINGHLVLERGETTNYYTWLPMDEGMVKALKRGTNTIAVHCRNEHHPQCIDVGIVDVVPNGRIKPARKRNAGAGKLRVTPLPGTAGP